MLGEIIIYKPNGLIAKRFIVKNIHTYIGRDKFCDIRVEHPDIAPQHCLIIASGDGKSANIRNISVTNPTLVNGKSIESSSLHLNNDDILTIGHIRFQWKYSNSDTNHGKDELSSFKRKRTLDLTPKQRLVAIVSPQRIDETDLPPKKRRKTMFPLSIPTNNEQAKRNSDSSVTNMLRKTVVNRPTYSQVVANKIKSQIQTKIPLKIGSNNNKLLTLRTKPNNVVEKTLIKQTKISIPHSKSPKPHVCSNLDRAKAKKTSAEKFLHQVSLNGKIIKNNAINKSRSKINTSTVLKTVLTSKENISLTKKKSISKNITTPLASSFAKKRGSINKGLKIPTTKITTPSSSSTDTYHTPTNRRKSGETSLKQISQQKAVISSVIKKTSLKAKRSSSLSNNSTSLSSPYISLTDISKGSNTKNLSSRNTLTLIPDTPVANNELQQNTTSQQTPPNDGKFQIVMRSSKRESLRRKMFDQSINNQLDNIDNKISPKSIKNKNQSFNKPLIKIEPSTPVNNSTKIKKNINKSLTKSLPIYGKKFGLLNNRDTKSLCISNNHFLISSRMPALKSLKNIKKKQSSKIFTPQQQKSIITSKLMSLNNSKIESINILPKIIFQENSVKTKSEIHENLITIEKHNKSMEDMENQRKSISRKSMEIDNKMITSTPRTVDVKPIAIAWDIVSDIESINGSGFGGGDTTMTAPGSSLKKSLENRSTRQNSNKKTLLDGSHIENDQHLSTPQRSSKKKLIFVKQQSSEKYGVQLHKRVKRNEVKLTCSDSRVSTRLKGESSMRLAKRKIYTSLPRLSTSKTNRSNSIDSSTKKTAGSKTLDLTFTIDSKNNSTYSLGSSKTDKLQGKLSSLADTSSTTTITSRRGSNDVSKRSTRSNPEIGSNDVSKRSTRSTPEIDSNDVPKRSSSTPKKEPANVSKQSSSTTMKRASNDVSRRLSTTAEKDLNVSRRSSTTAEKDSNVSRRSSTTAEKDSNVSRRSSTTAEKDSNVSRRSSTTAEIDSNVSRRLSTTPKRASNNFSIQSLSTPKRDPANVSKQSPTTATTTPNRNSINITKQSTSISSPLKSFLTPQTTPTIVLGSSNKKRIQSISLTKRRLQQKQSPNTTPKTGNLIIDRKPMSEPKSMKYLSTALKRKLDAIGLEKSKAAAKKLKLEPPKTLDKKKVAALVMCHKKKSSPITPTRPLSINSKILNLDQTPKAIIKSRLFNKNNTSVVKKVRFSNNADITHSSSKSMKIIRQQTPARKSQTTNEDSFINYSCSIITTEQNDKSSSIIEKDDNEVNESSSGSSPDDIFSALYLSRKSEMPNIDDLNNKKPIRRLRSTVNKMKNSLIGTSANSSTSSLKQQTNNVVASNKSTDPVNTTISKINNSNLIGVKKTLELSPAADDRNISGVKKILHITPQADYTKVTGMKNIFNLSPIPDYTTHVTHMKRVFTTSPVANYTDVTGVKQMFTLPPSARRSKRKHGLKELFPANLNITANSIHQSIHETAKTPETATTSENVTDKEVKRTTRRKTKQTIKKEETKTTNTTPRITRQRNKPIDGVASKVQKEKIEKEESTKNRKTKQPIKKQKEVVIEEKKTSKVNNKSKAKTVKSINTSPRVTRQKNKAITNAVKKDEGRKTRNIRNKSVSSDDDKKKTIRTTNTSPRTTRQRNKQINDVSKVKEKEEQQPKKTTKNRKTKQETKKEVEEKIKKTRSKRSKSPANNDEKETEKSTKKTTRSRSNKILKKDEKILTNGTMKSRKNRKSSVVSTLTKVKKLKRTSRHVHFEINLTVNDKKTIKKKKN